MQLPRPEDTFDWDFNTSIRRKAIFDLAGGEFVRKAHLLIGPPSRVIWHRGSASLINSGHTVLYRSIDTRDLLQTKRSKATRR